MVSEEVSILRPLRSAFLRVSQLYRRYSGRMTLGVRAMILDDKGRVFLVKHSYVSGWHMPGGGVEPGETIVAALEREVREEANIELTASPILHAIYYNTHGSWRDHVAFYIVRQFRQIGPPEPNKEIIAHGFFAADELPADTTKGTRERVSEVLKAREPAQFW